MKWLNGYALALCFAHANAGAADQALAADLPPIAQVVKAITSHPSVSGARAGITLEDANRRRLLSGPYEYNLRLGSAARQDTLANRNLQEWDLTLERPWRLADKADLDSQLGDQGVEQAKLAAGDARHETGRALLRMWFGWLKSVALGGHWEAQKNLLARQASIVARRVQLGDAPRQEQALADAAVAQAEYALSQAAMRRDVAASELSRSFPPVLLTTPPPPPLEPRAVSESLDHWQSQIAEHNHELGYARGEVKRRVTAAQRARADRTPDPTLGLRYASERSGAERVVGLVLVIPISGSLRQASSEVSYAQIEIAEQRMANVQRRLEAEAAATYSAATRSFESWGKARTAANALEQNAAQAATAYRLGELGLAELLASQRLAIEARLAASLVQLEATETRYRLLLDAHQLWDLDED